MDPGKTKVILVGNSNFPNWGGENKNIPNVDQNIETLKTIFFDPVFFGLPDDQKHLVTIKDETSQEILLKVKRETKSFPEKDQFERLIFYYAGHGIPGEEKKLFLASRDTVRSDYEITAVDSNKLFSYLNGFGARELIVILDCCYAAQSKENMGDADSLIEKCLPEEREELEVRENGTYYLFASGKDNVAKFNPLEPKTPTYFTTALVNSIRGGTEPGIAYIKMSDLFEQIQQQILSLKKSSKIDIPNPRPILVGDVKSFLFCKNKKFENEEDKDWAELKKSPSNERIKAFQAEHPNSRFETEVQKLITKLIKANKLLRQLEQTNDVDTADRILADYDDIPEIAARAKTIKNAMLDEDINNDRTGKRAEHGVDASVSKPGSTGPAKSPDLKRSDGPQGQQEYPPNPSAAETKADNSNQARPSRNLATSGT